MKKTLLALAAIAATSASFAQSSVTLYGVLDASIESVKGDKTVTRVSSGNLNTSRLGVKGVEDLGGGTFAKFNLETGVFGDTGAQSQGARFWNRQAWVGLAGGFGELRLGRTISPIYDIAAGVLGVQQPYDELKIVGSRATGTYSYVDNAITYLLPTMVPGLSAQLQYTAANGSTATPGNETPGSNVGKAYGLNVKYVAGPFAAGIGYENIKDDNGVATDGNQKANDTLGYVSYDFGAAKVTAYYSAETNLLDHVVATSVDTRRTTVAGAKVAVPFTPEFTLQAGLATARNVLGNQAGNDNVQLFTLKGLYALSKRTTAYALFTNVNNGAATFDGIAGNPTAVPLTVADKTTHGIAVGVSHSF
jgi:predicted porin